MNSIVEVTCATWWRVSALLAMLSVAVLTPSMLMPAASPASDRDGDLSYGRDHRAPWRVLDVGHRAASDGQAERWFAWLANGREDLAFGGDLAKQVYDAGKQRDDWIVVTCRQVWHPEIHSPLCWHVVAVDTTAAGYAGVMAEIEHRSLHGVEFPLPPVSQ